MLNPTRLSQLFYIIFAIFLVASHSPKSFAVEINIDDELFELKSAQLDEKIAVKKQFEAIFRKEQMEKFEKLSLQKQRRRKGHAKKKRR